MTWARLDDGFPTHPKVIGLSDRAFRIHVEAICYGCKQLTDGFVPTALYRRNGRAVAELVTAGLWETTTGGWIIHDFLKFNPSRDEAESKSQSARHASRMRWASDSDKERTRERVGEKQDKEPAGFGEFYDGYPRKVGRIAAAQAFEKALARGATAEELTAAATRYRDDPARDSRFTPHPATWLNQGRWLDEGERPRPMLRSPEEIEAEWKQRRAEDDARIAAMLAEDYPDD